MANSERNFGQNGLTKIECPPFELGSNNRLVFPAEFNIEPRLGEIIPGTGRSSRPRTRFKLK